MLHRRGVKIMSSMRSSFLLFLIGIFLSIPVSAEVISQPEKKLTAISPIQLPKTQQVPTDHPSKKDCYSCHQDAKHKQLVMTKISENTDCATCHTANQSKPGFVKASQKQDKPAGKAGKTGRELTPVIKQKKSLPVTAGMSYPLYYQGTRIGDEPNEMVLIPAGEFIMGTDNRLSDEGPQHKVSLADFYIDIYEVTNLQYKKFNDATNRRSPTHFRNRTFPEGKADHPITYVTWNDADAYCQWAGKRLPTDEEWEKAARGNDGRWYPWGDEFASKKANTPLRWKEIGSFGDTTPVGSFEEGKSPYGLYDISGNVWEWTASWYTAYPNNKKESESYGERYKTLKGGSWFDCSFYKCGISAPVFNRAFFAKKVKNDSFGFRCAKNANSAVNKKSPDNKK